MYIPTKRKVRVTLDVDCYDDLYLQEVDWKDLLQLEGDENVDVDIKDIEPVWWKQWTVWLVA